MKFTFKIQQYQTDAVDSLVKCFEGQEFADKVQYLRDKGIIAPLPVDTNPELGFEEIKQEEIENDNGYRNADLVLSEKDLLSNIKKIQDKNFINRSFCF